MNLEKLKIIEEHFFEVYPKGFEDEELLKIVKRHNTAKISEQVHQMFALDMFGTPELIVQNMTKIVSKSTLVSLFEKPKFRDEVLSMSMEQKDILSIGLYEMLHGDMSAGYDMMLEVLSPRKLAKWSIISLFPYYYRRDKELFIKPTTTKDVIKYFEIEDLVYKPKPSYEFYSRYKEKIDWMKTKVDKRLGEDNAGFTGFLMMGMAE